MTAAPILTTPTTPSPTPAEALAQMDVMRTDPLHPIQRNAPAALEAYQRLVMIAYAPPPPAPGPAPAVAGPAPDQLAAQLAANREAMLAEPRGSRAWHALLDEREALLLAQSTLPAAPADPLPPGEAAAVDVAVTEDDSREAAAVAEAFTLPEGSAWKQDMLAEGHAIARAELGPDGGRTWARVVATIRAAAAGPALSPEACHAVLRERWGDDYEARLDAAHLAFGRLPDATIEWFRLHPYPDVIDCFADLGEHLATIR